MTIRTLPSGVEVLTAADAESAQMRAAGSLSRAGLGEGDRVAFCLPSSAGLLCAVLGALRVGIVPVLLNATLLDREREVLLEDAAPSLTVVDRDQLDRLGAGPPATLSPHPLARPMHYTSGTTGRAEGRVVRCLGRSDRGGGVRRRGRPVVIRTGDVHLVCSPMYHSVSIRFAAGTLLRGGTCVDPPDLRRGDGAATRSTADRSRPDDHIPRPVRPSPGCSQTRAACGRGFASLRLLVHAGSPCPPALKRAAFDLLPSDVLWEFYGSTEGQFTVCPPGEWLEHPGTVGRARAGRTLTVDPDGTVWCQPPAFARFSYWRDEASTAAAWRDGAFTVGDLGRLDEDGYLYPRRQPRRPDHHRWGQRLPGGGGGRPRRGDGVAEVAVSRSTTSGGGSGCALPSCRSRARTARR